MTGAEGERPTKPASDTAFPEVHHGSAEVINLSEIKTCLNYRQRVEENSVFPRFYLVLRISHGIATREGREGT